MLTNRQSFGLVIFLIIVGVVSLLLLRSSKDYSILPSTLPQNELWTIEYAEAIQEKAFNIGIPQVLDEKALLELVRHAYQWDKNAMIQYAKIQKNEMEIEPDKDESLAEFLKKYSHELVDRNGKPLADPAVLQLSYYEFMKKLADLKYPVPSNYMASRMYYSSGSDNGIDGTGYKNPLTNENHKMLVLYTENTIKGGYRYYGALASYILFQTGADYKDPNSTQLNQLIERIDNLTEVELETAINAYQTCAKHGSSLCMVRMVEAYFYGVGVNKNFEYAYAWSKLANQAYQVHSEKAKVNADSTADNAEKALNNYNLELAVKLKEQLTPVQLEQSQKIVEQLKQTISWDYEAWVSKRDPVLPMP